jgi:hypothetical protein
MPDLKSGGRRSTATYSSGTLCWLVHLIRPVLASNSGLIMTSKMPPVPPGNRSDKGTANRSSATSIDKSVTHEHHPNSAEEGETANIKQNTTNKGFFRGRRFEK